MTRKIQHSVMSKSINKGCRKNIGLCTDRLASIPRPSGSLALWRCIASPGEDAAMMGRTPPRKEIWALREPCVCVCVFRIVIAPVVFALYCLFVSVFHTTESVTIMSIPATLITGSIAYIVLGVVLIGLIFSARSVGKLSKDDAA